MAINALEEVIGTEPKRLPPARLLAAMEDALGVKKQPSPRLLAPREREVLDLLSKGRAYKQIADEMDLSMGTIRTYIRRLYGKLNVNCRTEAVVIYLTRSISG
ncbi:MAG TPA: LuxR C-terminal-related transcriptional regulator [Candidatus Sulfotelmatobacter sp.]|nr:LuxR C-terminal-related transcriptional regulator [Candidatus Sulfotelmatobacter sp.]